MRRSVKSAVVAAAAVAVVGSTVPAASGPTPDLISARLAAVPSSYSGKCPTEIKFTGTITAPRPGKVTYRFLRSDGGAEDPVETVFAKPETQVVGMTWRVGGPAAEFADYRGWLTLQILEPIRVQATPATFRLRCAQSRRSRTP